MRELRHTELRRSIDPKALGFRTTETIEPKDNVIIGQKKALRALEVAIGMGMSPHNNIYVAGSNKIGKASIVKLALSGNKDHPKPKDLVYVYNFDDPYRPIALSFPAGQGQKFKADFEGFYPDFVELLKEKMNDPQNAKTAGDFRRNTELMKIQLKGRLIDIVKKHSMIAEVDESGNFHIHPGKTEDELVNLSEEEITELQATFEAINRETAEIHVLMREIERSAAEFDQKLYLDLFRQVVQTAMESLLIEYSNAKTLAFLASAQEYLLEIADVFVAPNFDPDSLENLFAVNLLVNNSETAGPPVVQAFNCDYGSLFGTIEITKEGDAIHTDHTFIKSGLVHEANGGYLIIRLSDLLMDPYWSISWQKLKESIRKQEIEVTSLPSFLAQSVKTLEPETIPLNFKVILVGDYWLYEQLSEFDEQFSRLFQKKVELAETVVISEESQGQYIDYIATFINKSGLKQLTAAAVARILEYGNELAEDGRKLSLKMAYIRDLIKEADFVAQQDNSDLIKPNHVEVAIANKIDRSNYFEEKYREFIDEGIRKIASTGERVGQINGLTVFELSDRSFAIPIRVTAVTYRGSQIVSIEKNIKMAGPSHNKGSMILSAYLKNRYGQERSFPFSASITLEQSYDGVDGDSATQAELIAILSSLAQVPIRQELAITGSMNQLGDTQAIGGVNEKITGWYYTCKHYGLSGTQGVVVPEDNVAELMLPKEIVKAVESGVFKIYTVSNIEEAIELLTGTKMGDIDAKINARSAQLRAAGKDK